MGAFSLIVVINLLNRGRNGKPNMFTKRNHTAHPKGDSGLKRGVGVNGGNRIINGDETSIKSHPWAVQLRIDMSDGNTGRCGGTIIGKNIVATAAHCLEDATKGTIGYGSAAFDDFSHNVYFSANDCFKHKTIDAAFIRTKKDFKSDYAKALDWAKSPISTGQDITVFGWGMTEGNGQTEKPAQLMEVDLEVVKGGCQGGDNGAGMDGYFCAGGSYSGEQKDACQGDSGSGVECKIKGGTVLCGIVSKGPAPPNCGSSPGTYVDVGYGEIADFFKQQDGFYKAERTGESDSASILKPFGGNLSAFLLLALVIAQYYAFACLIACSYI